MATVTSRLNEHSGTNFFKDPTVDVQNMFNIFFAKIPALGGSANK